MRWEKKHQRTVARNALSFPTGEGRGLTAARLWKAAATHVIGVNNGQPCTAGTPTLSTLWPMTSSTVLWMSDCELKQLRLSNVAHEQNDTEVVEPLLRCKQRKLPFFIPPSFLFCVDPFPFSHSLILFFALNWKILCHVRHQQSAEAGWPLKNRWRYKIQIKTSVYFLILQTEMERISHICAD